MTIMMTTAPKIEVKQRNCALLGAAVGPSGRRA